MERRIAIVGAGRLGESLLRGFLSPGWRTAAALVVTARRPERRAELSDRYGVVAEASNAAAVSGARLAIVSVKPQDVDTVMEEIASAVSPDHTLLSVAAGVTTSWIESHLPDGARVVRAMPNTPSLVQEGIAAISPGKSATDVDLALAEEALGHLGQVVR